jgi:hypothetical protein
MLNLACRVVQFWVTLQCQLFFLLNNFSGVDRLDKDLTVGQMQGKCLNVAVIVYCVIFTLIYYTFLRYFSWSHKIRS